MFEQVPLGRALVPGLLPVVAIVTNRESNLISAIYNTPIGPLTTWGGIANLSAYHLLKLKHSRLEYTYKTEKKIMNYYF